MSSKSLTQSKILSPSSKSASFYHIDIPAQSLLSNESFAKQNFTPVQNQEDSTPYLQYIAHEQTNGVSTGFNLQSKILSVLKKGDRSYNESVFVYKHLKHSAFFQKFRQDNPNLRLTEALINLSKILEYHVYSPGAIIHRKGDPSNKKVYLVFSGKIDLYETIEKKSGFETPRPSAPKLENKTKSAFSLLGNREDSKTPKASARSEKPQPPQNVILNTRALVDQAASTEVAQEILTLNTMKSNTDIKSFKFEPINDEEVNDKSGGNKAFRGGKKILKKMKTVAFALKHAKTTLDLDKAQGSSRRNEEVPLQDSERHFNSIDNLDNVMMKMKLKEESTSIVMDIEEEKEKKPIVESGLQKSVSLMGAKNKFRKNFLKASFKGIAEEDLPKSSSNREEFVDSQTSIENYMIQSDREVKIKKGSVYKGEIFGDESLEKVGYTNYEGFDYKRKYTAQVGGDKECVLLSFCREDYEYLCTRYDPENTRVLDFLLDYVPDLDKTAKEENLRRLESHFSEEIYNWHQQVTVQGQRGDKIYLLFDGLCEVLKEVRSGCGADLSMSGMTDLGRATSVQGLTRDYSYGNKVMSILICVVKSGVFLGEEILFNGTGEYEYTVKAGSTKVRLLELDKETFLKVIPERVQKSLRNLYNQKTKHNQEILNSKLQLQADIKQQRSGATGGAAGGLFDSFDDIKETKETKNSQTKRKLGANMVQSRVIKTLVTITSKVVETSSVNRQQIYGLSDVKKESEVSLRRYLESEPIEKRNNTTKEMSWNHVLAEGNPHGKKRPRVLLKKKKGSILRSENNIARPSSEIEEKRLLGNKSPQMSSTVKALMSPKASSSKRIETFRFDFGRDLSESLLVKEIDVERDREARLVLKLKKKMLDRERNITNGSRPSMTTTASYYLKNGSFASNNTPKNSNTAGSEPNWSAWGTPNPKTSGTPTSNFAKDSVSLSSPIHSVKPKMTKRFSFHRKEIPQKAVVEKSGRAYSLNVIQKPLKDENREEYPVIEIFGKGF